MRRERIGTPPTLHYSGGSVNSLTVTPTPVKPPSSKAPAPNPIVEAREQSKREGCAALP